MDYITERKKYKLDAAFFIKPPTTKESEIYDKLKNYYKIKKKKNQISTVLTVLSD